MRLTRSVLSIGLITFGTGLFVLSLWISAASANVSLIISSMGLAIGVGGWLLQKAKMPMSLIRNISSALLITIGAGLFILPLFILSIHGTNVAFVNIALMNL